MATSFERLKGAAADVRELEYVSALHQTDTKEVRRDASIKAEDIQFFLSSRYGIKVEEKQVRESILAGLGGGCDDDDVLDLVEVVAMLLIPIFLKAAAAGDNQVQETARQGESTGKAPLTPIQPPAGLLEFALKVILHDVTGDEEPKQLTPELIQRILVAYGEYEMASDASLVQELLEATLGGANGTNGTGFLDREALAKALTHDVKLYDVQNEVRMTTNFNDVFVTDETIQEREQQILNTFLSQEELDRQHRENQNLQNRVLLSEDLERVYTFPALDITAGTYRSKGLIVSLWATILITYFAYFVDFNRGIDKACGDELDAEAISCESLISIANWMIFFFGFSLYGVVSVFLGSIGNAVDTREAWKPLVSFAFVLLLVLIPYATAERDDAGEDNRVLYAASLAFGFVTCVYHLSQAASLYFSEVTLDDYLSCGTLNLHNLIKSTVCEEQKVKQATAMKLSDMMKNAIDINEEGKPTSIKETYNGKALKTFVQKSKETDTAGGFRWCWAQILGRTQIFSDNGIWVPARMIASNLAQYVVAVYILFGGLALTAYFADEFDAEGAKRNFQELVNQTLDVDVEDEVVNSTVASVSSLIGQFLTGTEVSGADIGCDNTDPEEFVGQYCPSIDGTPVCNLSAGVNYLCPLLDPEGLESLDESAQIALLNASGFAFSELRGVVVGVAASVASAGTDSLYPEEQYMITIPMYIGTFVAFMSALFLAVVYIPSVMTTILRLRSGDIATLRSKDFSLYRKAPEQAAQLTGSSFWGSLFSSLILGGAVGLIVFFFVWQASAYYAQRTIAFLIGVISVFLVRFVIVNVSRGCMWQSFYRTMPRAANITILALEWGHFALSAGYIMARTVGLIVAAGMFIGRMDTPFLAEGVGRLGPINLDNAPTVHLRDILSHEAHRHPYIEQLGVIYLMKLRYSSNFGKRAGSCWRLIFVCALMPWLHKYRIMARPEDDETKSQHLTKLETQNPNLAFVTLQRKSVTASGDDDDDPSSRERAQERTDNMVEGIEEYLRTRIKELKAENSDLRLAQAQSASVEAGDRIQELEEENQRLRRALAGQDNSA